MNKTAELWSKQLKRKKQRQNILHYS